mgnify:CR=1 FL=1
MPKIVVKFENPGSLALSYEVRDGDFGSHLMAALALASLSLNEAVTQNFFTRDTDLTSPCLIINFPEWPKPVIEISYGNLLFPQKQPALTAKFFEAQVMFAWGGQKAIVEIANQIVKVIIENVVQHIGLMLKKGKPDLTKATLWTPPSFNVGRNLGAN